jgi:hypothetical protein
LFEGLRWWPARPLSFSLYERAILRRVRKYGWTSVGVRADAEMSSFTYTIGFWQTLGSPDIVVAGIEDRPADMLLWEAFRGIKSGELTLAEGEPWRGWLQNGDYVWRQVHPSQWTTSNFGSGFWYNETHPSGRPPPPPAFQLVSPDFAGRLPWEAGYDEEIRREQHEFYAPAGDAAL